MSTFLSSIQTPLFYIRVVEMILSIICYVIFCVGYERVTAALRFVNSYSQSESFVRYTLGLTGIIFYPALMVPINLISILIFRETGITEMTIAYEAIAVICYFTTSIMLITAEYAPSVAGCGGFCMFTSFLYGAVLSYFLWDRFKIK